MSSVICHFLRSFTQIQLFVQEKLDYQWHFIPVIPFIEASEIKYLNQFHYLIKEVKIGNRKIAL